MIAISYRREDSLPIAGRLYDRLQAKFGKPNVFMDFDSIRPGLDFREQIKETIERSNVVIAIIGPRWLGEREGSRRIDEPNDLVRLEIAYALKRGIPVIPVLLNDTPMPNAERLPPDIEALAFRHALPLDSGLDFHQHADRLIGSIAEFAETEVVRTALAREDIGQSGPTEPSPRTEQRRTFSMWVAWACLLIAAGLGVWYFADRQGAADTADSKTSITQESPTDNRSRASPVEQKPPPSPPVLPTPEPTLESQLLGKWQGPRHLIEYFPDHTFAQTGLKVDGMTWRLDGRVLTKFYPDLGKATPAWYPGAGAFTLTIVSIKGNELTTRNDTGAPFVECRVTIDTPDERQGAAARAIANTKKMQASLRLTAPTPASSPSVSKSDVNKSASPAPSQGNVSSPSAATIPAMKEPIRNAFGMIEGNYKCQYRANPRSHAYTYTDKTNTKHNATMSDSNYFTVTGTRFRLDRQAVLKIHGTEKKTGSDMKYTMRWEGDILRSGSAVYTFKPRSVHIAEKNPKNCQPADYDLARCREALGTSTWTLKYSEPTLVQIEDGETWTLEK